MLTDDEVRDVEMNIRNLYGHLEHLETITKVLMEEQEMLTNAMVQQSDAMRTLEALEEMGGERKEMVIPLGGSAFVKGVVDLSPMAILRIGTDLLVEKPIPEAIETMKGRISELDSHIRDHENSIVLHKERRTNALSQIEDLRGLLDRETGPHPQ